MESRRPHPVGQNGAVEHDPVPGEDLRLAVERHMLAELCDRYLRQQRLGWDAALDQMRGRRRLGDARAALRTGVAGPHGLDDAILRGRHVEAAGAVLADPNHQAAAAGTCEARGLDHAFDARQMGGKGAGGAGGSLPRDRAARTACALVLALLRFGDRDLDIFENELQLIGIELLRTLAEPRAFIFFDEQSKTFDRLLRRGQLARDVKPRGALMLGAAMLAIGADAFGVEHGALSFEQGAQIGGKLCETGRIEALRHAANLSHARRRMKPNSRSVRSGRHRHDPLSDALPV